MELDLQKIAQLLLRKSWIIVACALIVGVGSYVYSAFVITPLYAAKTTLYVYNNENRKNTATVTSTDITVSQQLVETYIVLLRSNTVLEEVAQRTKLGYSAKQIRGMMTASAENETEIFNVTVHCPVPEHAAVLANTIAEVGKETIVRVVKAGSVEVVDTATVPWSPSYPNEAKNGLIGLLIGAFLAAAVLVIMEIFDTRIKSEESLNENFEIPVICLVPVVDALTPAHPYQTEPAKEGNAK